MPSLKPMPLAKIRLTFSADSDCAEPGLHSFHVSPNQSHIFLQTRTGLGIDLILSGLSQALTLFYVKHLRELFYVKSSLSLKQSKFEDANFKYTCQTLIYIF